MQPSSWCVRTALVFLPLPGSGEIYHTPPVVSIPAPLSLPAPSLPWGLGQAVLHHFRVPSHSPVISPDPLVTGWCSWSEHRNFSNHSPYNSSTWLFLSFILHIKLVIISKTHFFVLLAILVLYQICGVSSGKPQYLEVVCQKFGWPRLAIGVEITVLWDWAFNLCGVH